MEKQKPVPKYKVIFYQTPLGAEPVRQWLQSLDKSERLHLGQAMQGSFASDALCLSIRERTV
jgi:hypothetical protein